jgi:hypothetical protein
LLTSTSSRACAPRNAPTNARTEARLARSSGKNDSDTAASSARMLSIASPALCSLRRAGRHVDLEARPAVCVESLAFKGVLA